MTSDIHTRSAIGYTAFLQIMTQKFVEEPRLYMENDEEESDDGESGSF